MSFNNKAVITLQVGHYANYVGTHFWNAQELSFQVAKEKNDLDHDVFYREGFLNSGNTKQVTYTPRLVSVDLKGALGSLPEFGDLYHQVPMTKTELSQHAAQNFWHSKLEIERAEAHHKSNFVKSLEELEGKNLDEDKDICENEIKKLKLTNPDETTPQSDTNVGEQLEQDVKLWSDFLRTRFHPKTNVVLGEYHHGNSKEFDIHGAGIEAWSNGQGGSGDIHGFSEEIEDHIRYFVEEADFLKGFQLINDSTDGFGGVSSKISEHIQDEYGGQCLLAFPTLPSHYNETKLDAIQSTTKMLNMALTTKSLSDNCHLITPLSLATDTFPIRGVETRKVPTFDYNPDLHYHTSAILALGLDTLSLPWRSLSGPYASPSEVAHGLSSYGRKIANLELVFPFPKPSKEKLNPFLNSYTLSDTISISPHACFDKNSVDSVWCQSVSSRGILGSEAANMDFLGYFDRIMHKTATAVTTSRCPVPVGWPFPNHLSNSSYWNHTDKTLPMVSLWQSSKNSGNIVSSLAERCSRIKLQKLHRFTEAGLDEDSLQETIEGLHTLSDCYQANSDAI